MPCSGGSWTPCRRLRAEGAAWHSQTTQVRSREPAAVGPARRQHRVVCWPPPSSGVLPPGARRAGVDRRADRLRTDGPLGPAAVARARMGRATRGGGRLAGLVRCTARRRPRLGRAQRRCYRRLAGGAGRCRPDKLSVSAPPPWDSPPPGASRSCHCPEPIALTRCPASLGIVVVSGTLDLLDGDECAAMLAHEQSHRSAPPTVRPHRRDRRRRRPAVAAHVSGGWFATERWADEAASVVGDRGYAVARAIIKVALARTEQAPAGALGMSGSGVPTAPTPSSSARLRRGFRTEISLAASALALPSGCGGFHHSVSPRRGIGAARLSPLTGASPYSWG